MSPSSISFLADCPICKSNVSSTTKLGREDLIKALEQDEEVIAVHISLSTTGGDHQWKLTKEQRANLRKHIAEGLV